MGTKVLYPKEVKWKKDEMKQADYKNREIMELMELLEIKDKKQIKTQMKWYRNGETYNFSRPLASSLVMERIWQD